MEEEDGEYEEYEEGDGDVRAPQIQLLRRAPAAAPLRPSRLRARAREALPPQPCCGRALADAARLRAACNRTWSCGRLR